MCARITKDPRKRSTKVARAGCDGPSICCVAASALEPLKPLKALEPLVPLEWSPDFAAQRPAAQRPGGAVAVSVAHWQGAFFLATAPLHPLG